ncbi:unnamed protein product [Symbiodinium sp. CCMP2456]|nr:unnamed protein product [Symbiodinium sp. CCMP2456]
MEPWVIVAITAGIDVVVCALFSVIFRPCVDKDGNNRIGLNELPQWAVSLGPVVDGGGFYNLGTLTLLQTLLEAFAFSATYGLITVLTCNVLFIRLDKTLGSILTVYTVFQAMQFQCTYSTNGVHVATSHIIHFVYYACGFLPLYFYRRSMAAWLVTALVAVRLIAHTALKFYVWPKYPSFHQIFPLFERVNGELKQWCTVETYPEKSKSLPLMQLLSLCIPFPVYEMLNMHITSCMCFGGIISLLCMVALPEGSDTSRSLAITVGASSLAALLYMFLPCGWVPGKLATLSRFFPRTLAVLGFAAGAGLVTLNLTPEFRATTDNMAAVIIVTGHSLHAFGLFLFLWSWFAARRHLSYCFGAAEYDAVPKLGKPAQHPEQSL